MKLECCWHNVVATECSVHWRLVMFHILAHDWHGINFCWFVSCTGAGGGQILLCTTVLCCSYGVFSPVEVSDVSRLVARLARNLLLLVRPTDSLSCHHSQLTAALLPDVHRHVIHSCISNTFPSLLYAYCDFWR